MRNRIVRTEFFSSESLAECSVSARLLFIGLWVIADDRGQLRVKYRQIAHQVFPHDNMSPDALRALLAELETTGCINAHESDDGLVIVIPNFLTYQKINRPSKPVIERVGQRVAGAFGKPEKFIAIREHSLSIQGVCNEGCMIVENSVEKQHSVSTHHERKKEVQRYPKDISDLGQCGGGFSTAHPTTTAESQTSRGEIQAVAYPHGKIMQRLKGLWGGEERSEGVEL